MDTRGLKRKLPHDMDVDHNTEEETQSTLTKIPKDPEQSKIQRLAHNEPASSQSAPPKTIEPSQPGPSTVGRTIRQIEQGTDCLKKRGDHYKQQLRIAVGRIAELKSENEEGSRELQRSKVRIEQLEAAKEKADSRLGGYKGHLKRSLQTSEQVLSELKNAENRISYLESLLAFEEKSGFSAHVSQRQLQ